MMLVKTDNIFTWINKDPKDRSEHVIKSADFLTDDMIKKFIDLGYKPYSKRLYKEKVRVNYDL